MTKPMSETRDELAHAYYLNNGNYFIVKKGFKCGFDQGVLEARKQILMLLRRHREDHGFKPVFGLDLSDWLDSQLNLNTQSASVGVDLKLKETDVLIEELRVEIAALHEVIRELKIGVR
jgi:hypothetical protein